MIQESMKNMWKLWASKTFGLYLAWKIFTFVLIFLNLWAFFDQAALPPDGDLFHMFMLFLVSHVLGKLSRAVNLPPLIGMLLAGFIYGNVFDIELNRTLESITRSMALMIILLRAGLHLDLNAIKKLSFVVFRLAFGPSIVETLTAAICVYFLFGLNIAWSMMLGFVLCASSPAVIVPGMIKLTERKLGTTKGIPTLMIAASSVDDVLAITGFTVCLSFAFVKSQSGDTWDLVKSILMGPFEALVGIIYGLIGGILLWYIPETCYPNTETKKSLYDKHRFVLLLAFSLYGLFGFQTLGLDGVGPLAILVLSFIASLRWRHCGYEKFSERSLKTLWTIFEHYLFCLIGSDVRIKSIESEVLLYGLITVAIGLLLRLIAVFLVTYGNGLEIGERIFTAVAWTSKATVQAAIGPVALDTATSEEERKQGRIVLTIAVLSIIITAPLSAIFIDVMSWRMLSHSATSDSDQVEDQQENSSSQQDHNLTCIDMTNQSGTKRVQLDTII